MILVLVSGCVVVSGEGVAEGSFGEVEASFEEPILGVDLYLSQGESLVLATDGEAPILSFSGMGLEWSVEEGILAVEAESGELEVVVPAGVPIRAVGEFGELTVIQEGSADLVACLGTGELSVEVPGGAWDLRTELGTGELSVSGVEHDPEAGRFLEALLDAGELSVAGGAD